MSLKDQNKHAFHRECFRSLNTNTDHLHFTYAQLDKKKNEIAKSEYVYSLIESANDQKKFAMIKREMNLPESSQSAERIVKNKYYIPNVNVFNYKKLLQSKDPQQSSENELLSSMLTKFEIKLNHHGEQTKVKGLRQRPFNLSYQRKCLTETSENSLRGFPTRNSFRDTCLQRTTNSYFTRTLNNTLYKIIEDAQRKQEECIQRKRIFIKEINNRQMKKQKEDISSTSNRYSKENGNKKGMFSFPIINKIIYGREDKNYFAEIKEKLYLEYLDKRKNHKNNINIPIEKESEEEEESEEKDD